MKLSLKQSFSFLLISLFSLALVGVGVIPLVSYAAGVCKDSNGTIMTNTDWGYNDTKEKCEKNGFVWTETTGSNDNGGNDNGDSGDNGSQVTGEVTIDKILKAINKEIINPAIIAIFAVALCVFIFGLVRFIWDKQAGGGFFENGKRHMVWGLVGMFIMASAFGIVQFIGNTLTLDFKINQDGSVTQTGGNNSGNNNGGVDIPPDGGIGDNPGGGGIDIPPGDNGGNGEKQYTEEECLSLGGEFIPPHSCDLSNS